jgi:intracellular multiplication protein IcmE
MSDDLENNETLGEDASFDEFEQQKTLGDLWRNNPMVKVGVILAAGAAIFFTIMLFGGEDTPVDISQMPGGADVTAAPGTAEATPKYVEAIKDFNEAEREEAIKTGGSAMPVPIEPPATRLEAPTEEAETEDPLQRWRRLQEERLKREVKQREAVKPAEIPGQQQAAAANEAVQAMAEVMNQQMSAILESQTTTQLSYKGMTGPEWLKDQQKAKEEEAAKIAAANATGETIKEILIPAGTIEYAQLITEANSDVEGPILGQIVSGPLAGSRVLGSFETEDENVEYLVLEFDTLVTPDGISHDIDAVAIDPATALPGMATEVDHHYLKRIVLPMAAAFIEGVAEAGAKTTTTVVTVNDGGVVEDEEEADTGQQISLGVDKAGEELREILDDMADETEVTVIVHAGTPMGLLFLEEVTQDKENM